MQTIYYTTHNFIRHTENVVDLMEYRRRLERVAAPVTEPFFPERVEEPTATRARRRTGGLCPGLFLDFCASAAIVAMTVTVLVQFLAL
jgi:hypothetical protein